MAILLVVMIRWQTRPAYLDLSVTPPDAEVTLDGRPLALTDGWALIQESPGRHHLAIRAEGHEPQERTIDLVRGRDNTLRANVRLQARYGRLHAVSTPEGAAVEVRDRKGCMVSRGTTPFYSPRLPQGEYTLRFTKDLCAAHQVRAAVPSGERTAEVPPVVLPLVDGAEDSIRALEYLQTLRRPWQGAARYSNAAMTFGQFLKETSRRHGIAFTLNGRAFTAEGLEEDKLLDTPIFETPLDLGPNVRELSLRTVLDRIIDRVGNVPSGATFVPKKLPSGRYGLELTTGRYMVGTPVIVLHPARDLVTGRGALTGEQLATAVKEQLPFWREPDVLAWVAGGGLEFPPLPPVSLRFLSTTGALHVTHNWRVQEAVHAFLNQLRLARRTQGTLPSILRPVREQTESSRLLACLRSSWMPWKGHSRYADPKMTLDAFLKEIVKQHGVEITIKAQAFVAEGLEADKLRSTPVFETPLDLGPNARSLSVRAVLQHVLNRVENIPSGITFVPKKLADRTYGWELTTGQFLAIESVTVLHPVGDLVVRGMSGEQLVRAVRAQLPFWDYMNLVPGWDPEPEEKPPVREVPLDFLSVGGVLRITHNWRVQEAVDSFLNQLRQAARTRGTVPEVLRSVEKVTDSSRLLACARAFRIAWKGPRELDGSLSLRQFLHLVERHHGIPVFLNEVAFEADCPGLLDQSIGKGKVSFNPNWSVRAVLLDVVKGLRGRGGAALMPRKLSERTFGWEVTTPEAAEAEQLTVLHPAGDLLTGPAALSEKQLMGIVRGQLPLRERAVASIEFSPVGQAVVVSYHWRLQEQIDACLNQLRQARQAKKGSP